MTDLVEHLKELLMFFAALVTQPNALTIISVALLFFVGKHYWRDINSKIAICEAKHSKCERRFNVIARLLHGALQYDEALIASRNQHYPDQRHTERRASDVARANAMTALRKTLDEMLSDIEREDEDEEEALITGKRAR